MTAKAALGPFSEAQWARVTALLKDLDPSQKWWLGGYLSALGEMPAAGAPVASSGRCETLIAYGTETGNCKQLATELAKLCGNQGITVDLEDLARLKVRKLSKYRYLLVIVATHGDGDPPEPAVPFYEAIMDDSAPALTDLQFSVLALGDSTYEQFCVTGAQIDERLEALGGRRLLDRVECDVDFATPSTEWMTNLLPLLPATEQPVVVSGETAVADSVAEYDKNNPFAAEVLINTRLSDAQRSQPIYHMELAIDEVSLPLVAGDAVGVLADNPPELVAAVLDAVDLSGESPVTADGRAMALVEALRQHRDLTIPGAGFLDLWAESSGDPTLVAVRDGDRKVRRAFLRDHQVLDLMQRFAVRPEPQSLVDVLRPLQPRLYDVANPLGEGADELHLLVQAYSYPFGGRTVTGIASHYLADLVPGDEVRLYPHRNARFHLPDDPAVPVVLIGEGTGIAPYRAFWQTLEASDQRPPCWLVFGERSFEEDFLYQSDVLNARDQAVLERVDVVFYQDHPGRTLVDPLLEQRELLLAWLAQGAHLYFCGDKGRLEACEEHLKTHVDDASGDGFWKQLVADKRIHRNLY